MIPDNIVAVYREGFSVMFVLMVVMLVPGLLIGLIVAMFQAATQINESSLSFIPKLFVTLGVLLLAGPWLLKLLVGYTESLIMQLPYLIG
jgi:flagellar biosynthetic protein FliQ